MPFVFHERRYKTSAMTLFTRYINQCFPSVNFDDIVSTSVSIDSFRICAVHEYYIFVAHHDSGIEDKIGRQYQDNNCRYQLPLSVTLRTMSLTIWFARSKLLVFSPTSFSLLFALLTFTFLDFLSSAFFACAFFSFISCQARCLCRTVLAIYYILHIERSKILHNLLIQSLLRPWLHRTEMTGEGRLWPAE